VCECGSPPCKVFSKTIRQHPPTDALSRLASMSGPVVTHVDDEALTMRPRGVVRPTGENETAISPCQCRDHRRSRGSPNFARRSAGRRTARHAPVEPPRAKVRAPSQGDEKRDIGSRKRFHWVRALGTLIGGWRCSRAIAMHMISCPQTSRKIPLARPNGDDRARCSGTIVDSSKGTDS
jgi:hypothetical protein